MKLQKTKIWFKRILTGVLLAVVSLAITAHFSGNNAFAEGDMAGKAVPSAPGWTYSDNTGNLIQKALPANVDERICPAGYSNPETADPVLKCTKINDADVDELIKGFSTKISMIVALQEVLNKLILPVLIYIGALLDNSILFGNGMEARVQEIWIPVRNIVNILFVIFLVVIALYNILGLGDENSNFSIKAVLPKLVIGIIAVNFSFLGIKVFLDAISVGTNAIFALPNEVNEELGGAFDGGPKGRSALQKFCQQWNEGKTGLKYDKVGPDEMKKALELDIRRTVADQMEIANAGKMTKLEIENAVAAVNKVEEYNSRVEEREKGQICEADVYSSTKPEDLLTDNGEKFLLGQYGTQNAAFAMAVNMGRIVFYQNIPPNIYSMDRLFINAVMSMLMYLAYTVSFMALFVVLLARLLVLWLAIVFSPVLLLLMAVPQIKEQISGIGDLSSQFVKNAVAPLGIAFAMSIGWIMLQAVQGLENFETDTGVIYFEGGIPVAGLTNLQDLIVALGTLGVVWIAVFSAASGTIGATVTDWIKGITQKAAGWITTLPLKYTPIAPVKLPDGGIMHASPLQILTAADNTFNDYDYRQKLTEKMRGKSALEGPGGVHNVKGDPRQLHEWVMHPGNANMGTDTSYFDELHKRFKSEDELKEFLKGENSTLREAYLNYYRTGKDTVQGTKYLKEIRRLMGTYHPNIGQTKAGATPAAGAAAGAAGAAAAGTYQVGGQPVTAGQQTLLDQRGQTLITTINTGSEAAIRSEIENLNIGAAGQSRYPTAAELRAIIGEEAVTNLEQKLNLSGDSALDDYLKEVKEQRDRSGGGGSAGAAPTGGAPSPGTPAPASGGAAPPAAPGP